MPYGGTLSFRETQTSVHAPNEHREALLFYNLKINDSVMQQTHFGYEVCPFASLLPSPGFSYQIQRSRRVIHKRCMKAS